MPQTFVRVRSQRLTADQAFSRDKLLVGVLIRSADNVATTLIVRDGQQATDPIWLPFRVEAVPGGTTRFFPMPGPMEPPSNNGFFVDLDGNQTDAVVLYVVA